MVTPLAVGRQAAWQRLRNNDRAGRLLNSDDIDHFEPLCHLLKRVPAGAPVDWHASASRAEAFLKQWTIANSTGKKSEQPAINRQSRFDSEFARWLICDNLNVMIVAALADALDQSGLAPPQLASDRTGCVIGTSKASLRSLECEANARVRIANAASMMENERWLWKCFPDSPLKVVQYLMAARGPSACPVAACATGLVSIIQAAQLIHAGICDICIAGSADASLRASVLASFHRLGVTSTYPNPSVACRPFDSVRDGFIVGEGAAVLILESRRHAEARCAPTVSAQMVSGGWLTDPTGITQIDTSGAMVTMLTERLLKTGPLARTPDYISLHGTATDANDPAEAHGIHSVFGNHTPPCSGIKGAIGHLLGAAGSVELAFTILGLQDGVFPATTNLSTVDSNFRIPLLQTIHHNPSARTAMKLSLGFGGHVAGCIVQKA